MEETMRGDPVSEAMNRVWLVTGANSGFGRAIVESAVAAGDVVVATARRPSVLDDLVDRYPGQVDAAQLDVTDASGIEATVQDVLRRRGRIDVLVNNAGRTHVGALEETTDAELRSLFEVHLFGPAALTRAVLPHMRSRGSGSIVQLSSMGGLLSFAGFSAYSSTKFALEGLSEALSDEVRPFGIKVLLVEPGAFRTGLFTNGSESAEIEAYSGTVGETRRMVAEGDGSQLGDPAKAAAAIIAALDAEHTPLRLPLGNDAVDAIVAHFDGVRAEITTWEKVARDTAFND
jgi:NAD(P)-dependent dehydrogenase (short-subunit alcohol dehydrogenase family)